jgi:hypothetical protein
MTKVNTTLFYEHGQNIQFIEIRDDMKPMIFYTPSEFIKGYIQNDTIVLDQNLTSFYLFSSETEVYDISFVNSNEPYEDTEAEIERYKNYEFELNIYLPGDQVNYISTSFSYYGVAMGITLTPGCKFDIKYKGTEAFMFPKYKKLKFVEIKNTVPQLI